MISSLSELSLCKIEKIEVLSLYLDERRGVEENTSMRSREFPRAQPEGTPETECWYFLYSPTRLKVKTLSSYVQSNSHVQTYRKKETD